MSQKKNRNFPNIYPSLRSWTRYIVLNLESLYSHKAPYATPQILKQSIYKCTFIFPIHVLTHILLHYPAKKRKKERKEKKEKWRLDAARVLLVTGRESKEARTATPLERLTLLCLVRLAPISRRFFVASRTFRRGVPSPPGHSRPEGAEGLTPPAVPQRCTRAATLPIGPSTSPLRSRNVLPLHDSPPPPPPPPLPPPPPPLTPLVTQLPTPLLPPLLFFCPRLSPCSLIVPLSSPITPLPPPLLSSTLSPSTSFVSSLVVCFVSSTLPVGLSPVTFADDRRPRDSPRSPPPSGEARRSCLEIVAAATRPLDRRTSCRCSSLVAHERFSLLWIYSDLFCKWNFFSKKKNLLKWRSLLLRKCLLNFDLFRNSSDMSISDLKQNLVDKVDGIYGRIGGWINFLEDSCSRWCFGWLTSDLVGSLTCKKYIQKIYHDLEVEDFAVESELRSSASKATIFLD